MKKTILIPVIALLLLSFSYASEWEFTQIGELEVGDVMMDKDGNEIPITSIEKVHSEEGVMVYDLEVADYHYYFAEGVLVHNSGDWRDIEDSQGTVIRYKGEGIPDKPEIGDEAIVEEAHQRYEWVNGVGKRWVPYEPEPDVFYEDVVIEGIREKGAKNFLANQDLNKRAWIAGNVDQDELRNTLGHEGLRQLATDQDETVRRRLASNLDNENVRTTIGEEGIRELANDPNVLVREAAANHLDTDVLIDIARNNYDNLEVFGELGDRAFDGDDEAIDYIVDDYLSDYGEPESTSPKSTAGSKGITATIEPGPEPIVENFEGQIEEQRGLVQEAKNRLEDEGTEGEGVGWADVLEQREQKLRELQGNLEEVQKIENDIKAAERGLESLDPTRGEEIAEKKEEIRTLRNELEKLGYEPPTSREEAETRTQFPPGVREPTTPPEPESTYINFNGRLMEFPANTKSEFGTENNDKTGTYHEIEVVEDSVKKIYRYYSPKENTETVGLFLSTETGGGWQYDEGKKQVTVITEQGIDKFIVTDPEYGAVKFIPKSDGSKDIFIETSPGMWEKIETTDSRYQEINEKIDQSDKKQGKWEKIGEGKELSKQQHDEIKQNQIRNQRIRDRERVASYLNQIINPSLGARKIWHWLDKDIGYDWRELFKDDGSGWSFFLPDYESRLCAEKYKGENSYFVQDYTGHFISGGDMPDLGAVMYINARRTAYIEPYEDAQCAHRDDKGNVGKPKWFRKINEQGEEEALGYLYRISSYVMKAPEGVTYRIYLYSSYNSKREGCQESNEQYTDPINAKENPKGTISMYMKGYYDRVCIKFDNWEYDGEHSEYPVGCKAQADGNGKVKTAPPKYGLQTTSSLGGTDPVASGLGPGTLIFNPT